MKFLEGHGVVSFVGVAKNCGKTTTLLWAADQLRASNRRIGIASIGIDGEAHDVLIGTPKPKIVVQPDDLVVSARLAFESSTAHFEYLDTLAIETPLGEVLVARVRRPGTVVLAGLRYRADVQMAAEFLREAGAETVLIDGAYGRISAAHPDVADAIVVSTGGVVGPDEVAVADATAHLVARLSLPMATTDWERELIARALEEGRAQIGGSGTEPRALADTSSALVALRKRHREWKATDEAIAIPGLVSDSVAESLLGIRPGRTLLVGDPTAIHTTPRRFRQLRESWAIRALRVSPVVAISYNPTHPLGRVLDPRKLAEEIVSRCPKTTVFDPVVGIQ